MQLRYGRDTADAVDGSKDGSPDTLSTLPATTAEWGDVMTVEINLLARSTEPSAGYKDAKQYTLAGGSANGGATVGPTNDAYRRRLFTAVAVAVNPRSLRED